MRHALAVHAAPCHGDAVTLIQRFGSAVNVHLHCLVLDGVYRCLDDRHARPALLHHQYRLRSEHRQEHGPGLPGASYAEVGRELQIQYFADVYPVKVEAVGYRSMYDPENIKPRS